MDHELLLENYSSAAVNTDEYHYIFEGRKVFEYQTETDLLTQPRTYDKSGNIEEQMLYYGCKNSGLPYWKLKTLW